MADLAPRTAAQVGVLFDAKAAGWPAKYAPGGALAGRLGWLAGAVRRAAGPGAAVLDLGCGTGDLALRLARDGLRVTGCDISAAMLGIAAGRDGARAVRWAGLPPGWRELPFGDASFDVVVSSSVLEYVDDPAAVLRECARVLRPGGTLHCTVPDLRHPARWIELAARAAARSVPGPVPGRAGRYLAYLRLSRQRHRLRWWRATAAGLGLTLSRPGPGRPQPLMLLLMRTAADRTEG